MLRNVKAMHRLEGLGLLSPPAPQDQGQTACIVSKQQTPIYEGLKNLRLELSERQFQSTGILEVARAALCSAPQDSPGAGHRCCLGPVPAQYEGSGHHLGKPREPSVLPHGPPAGRVAGFWSHFHHFTLCSSRPEVAKPCRVWLAGNQSTAPCLFSQLASGIGFV